MLRALLRQLTKSDAIEARAAQLLLDEKVNRARAEAAQERAAFLAEASPWPPRSSTRRR
jgi:hypothetical protein